MQTSQGLSKEVDLLIQWKSEINNWALHYTNQIQLYTIVGWMFWSLNIFLLLLIQIFRIFASSLIFGDVVSILTVVLLSLGGVDGAIKPNTHVTSNEQLRDICIQMMDDISFVVGNPPADTELIAFVNSMKLQRQALLQKTQTQIPDLIQ